MNEENLEWIAISQLAIQLNVSKQTVYNRVKRGDYPSKEYKRGSMKGILVGIPKQ